MSSHMCRHNGEVNSDPHAVHCQVIQFMVQSGLTDNLAEECIVSFPDPPLAVLKRSLGTRLSSAWSTT